MLNFRSDPEKAPVTLYQVEKIDQSHKPLTSKTAYPGCVIYFSGFKYDLKMQRLFVCRTVTV